MIWKKTKKNPNECIYTIFIWLYTAQQSDWQLGRGQGGGTGPDLTSLWMGRPLDLQGKARVVRGRAGVPDWRQEQSYIQVRPTFHQSRTIHSILSKIWGWVHVSEAKSGVPGRRTQTRQLEKLSATWTWGARQGCGVAHPGESSPEMHSIFAVFVNTSGWT